MLNLKIGSRNDVRGATGIVCAAGVQGFAVYGPYATLAPGSYAAEFTIVPAAATDGGDAEAVCAIVDATASFGTVLLARAEVRLGELRAGRTAFPLAFTLPEATASAEYRVFVTGAAALRIEDHRPVVAVGNTGVGVDPAALLAAKRFPAAEGAPAVFRENEADLRGCYERGVDVAIDGEEVILTVRGVRVRVRSRDDLNFIGELFFDRVYSFLLDQPCCVVDIGMNIGLASLQFAAMPWVEEVHAFEPFADTYDRAMANLAINPALAAKISARNIGLSDSDEDRIFHVPDHGDSGAMSVRDVAGGKPVRLATRDAGATLRPIVAAARAAGRRVILKVDCEGAEFPVFASLEAAGLIGGIDAFMVEWHRVHHGRTQDDLIAPLRRHGFIAFDLSRDTGNGFFYAARLGQAPGAASPA